LIFKPKKNMEPILEGDGMITIIWHAKREEDWSADWIERVFSKVPHQTITDYSQTKIIHRSLIVYNATVDITDYVQRASKEGIDFGFIHISDEWNRDSTDVYKFAKVVLRNYYKDLGPKVINFPLGMMTGWPFDLPIKNTADRIHTWSFSGHVDKTTRPEMVKYMSQVPLGKSFFKVCGEYYGYPLNPVQLAEMCNDSIFVPCPQGNCSIDSYRVTEALGAGAIPIVERSTYWSNLFGEDHPLLEIDSWSNAPALIASLLSDKDALDAKRIHTHNWWLDHCDRLTSRMIGII
jgi:hypothetical protein